ncbi:MAG TPA: glutathione S-transferase family protein [Polyangiaceae bacterium]|nr:glutathione S-transferase family protein [Polyangiaceae bacterium]
MMKLVRGNNNASWSLRAWLALRRAGLPFEEHIIQLGEPDTQARIAAHSPSGLVPILFDGDVRVWDSLAICEYANDLRPAARLWPADLGARAAARSVSAEMHAGFEALRRTLPVQFALEFPVVADLTTFPADVKADIARLLAIWRECRARYGAAGPYLFGHFTIADAMFAPVASRFRTYNIPLGGAEAEYARTLWAMPEMAEWMEGARREWDD